MLSITVNWKTRFIHSL